MLAFSGVRFIFFFFLKNVMLTLVFKIRVEIRFLQTNETTASAVEGVV